EAVSTSKRIAEAYVQMGQLSSAILEYETILQRYPDDPDVQNALKEIESKANNFPVNGAGGDFIPIARTGHTAHIMRAAGRPAPTDIEDGRRTMHTIFVDSKVITTGDFDLCWTKHDLSQPPKGVIEPFIQILADKAVLPIDKALKMLCDHSRFAYLPLNAYDI